MLWSLEANFSYGHRTLANLLSVDADEPQIAEQAKHLDQWVHNDLTRYGRILELCRKMYFYVHIFRRLSKILLSQQTYVQSKID